MLAAIFGRPARKPIVLSAAGVIALLCGCTLITQPRKEDVAYENAQREINGPNENWRPGVQQASYEEEQRMQEQLEGEGKGFQLSDLQPSHVYENVKKWSGKGKNPDAARALYDEGDRLYRQALQVEGDQRKQLFLQAAGRFAEAAQRWPGSTLEHDALFHQGECYFFSDHYVEANNAFEKVIAKYRNSRYMDAIDVRRFKLAEYWLDLEQQNADSLLAVNLTDDERPWRDTRGNALRLYDKIRLDDPTGKLADDATMAAANAYFLAGDYLKADMFYSDLRRTYPSSEFQFQAHFLGMQAKLQSYQGEDYSMTPLEDAGKLIDQMRKQFPQEYAQHRDEVDLAYGQVRRMSAERRWRMATYWENRWDYGSARYYYNLVISEFPGTPIADAAKKRLAEIADKPNDPPQPLRPIGNLFNAGKDKLDIPTLEEKRVAEAEGSRK